MKYIVLCGGGPNCFSQLVMIHSLMQHNIIKYDTIEKIYATSAGTIMGTLLALKIPLNEVIDYIIERPWNKTIKLDMDRIFKFNEKKGLYDYDLFYKILYPIFSSNDISMDITLKNIYDQYKIELRMITTELESFQMIELSYQNYPDLKVMDAITMSCSCPPLFCPFLYEGKYYIDGGICNNYPIDLMKRDISTTEPILSINIRKININQDDITTNITDMNSFEYIQYIITKGIKKIYKKQQYNTPQCERDYELWYDADHLMYETELFTNFINDIEYRKKIKDKSISIINDYLNSLFKNIFNVENIGLAS
jgi:predicted acylesterase/phospholipase RssA